MQQADRPLGPQALLHRGLTLYGIGALLSAVSPNLGVLILGNSVFEGVGTALLIPPVYILATLWFSDLTSRAWAFGVISGLGGIGAAAGPLIGGVITTAISWRAAFVFQALVVATIILLSRRLVDPLPADPTRPFDAVGAILSAVGMFFVVFGILQAGTNNALFAVFVVLGARVPGRRSSSTSAPASERGRSRCCRQGCSRTARAISPSSPRTCSGSCSWACRSSCPSSCRRFAATARSGRASSSPRRRSACSSRPSLRERLAKRFAQRTLIVAGFVVTLAGIGLLLGFVHTSSRVVAFVPGLLLIGLGLGVMLTPSVNVVQSSFPEAQQGEISGLSRAVSNLGSTFGTAIAGTILVSVVATGTRSYAIAMITSPVRADRARGSPASSRQAFEASTSDGPAKT